MSRLRFDEFTLAAALTDLSRAPDAAAADAIEFRMDRADDPLDQLGAYEHTLPIIATNRATWEGGGASDDGRLQTLRRAAAHPAVAAIDIELATVEGGEADALREHAHDHEAAVVVSWHDFEATPAREELHTRLERAATWGDIGKASVTATTLDDVLDLLAVTRSLTRDGHAVATMSMGAVGRHSRAVAPLYGSKIGYAPIEAAEATASGQFPLARLRELIDSLRG